MFFLDKKESPPAITPANAAALFKELKTVKAVGKALGVSKTKANTLLHIAGVDLTPKTLEQLHPRPDNFQEVYDQLGSSRAYAHKYGCSQRQASKILKMWGVVYRHGGKSAKEVLDRKAKANRVWCVEMSKQCVLYGMGNCAYCRLMKNVQGS